MLEYFKIVEVVKTNESITIHLEEENIHPEEYSHQKLTSKGFHDTALIKDFPIRGKAAYLSVRRRKWLNEDTGKIVSRDWSVIAKGTRLSGEFATFLKEYFG